MKKNTGLPYENLTQQIFNEILNQDSVDTINVEHNVILQGKTIKHQIDVAWDFKLGNINYKTIIQAKDWRSKVKQEQLLAFKSILDDLPGQPKGIFVTRTGYQKGAFEFAESHGIHLYELRPPTDKDWEGSIKDVIINMVYYVPISKDANMIFDLEWVKKEKNKLQIPESETISINIRGLSNEIILFNKNQEPVGTVKDFIDSLYPPSLSEFPPTLMKYTFTEATFVQTDDSRFPLIKLLSIDIVISVTKHQDEIRIEGNNIVGYILKNVLDGSETRFDKTIKLLGNNNG